MNTIDNRRVVYQAIFINPEDIAKLIEKQGEKLPREIKDMHCTFKFQPSEEEIKKFSKLLGKALSLKIVGYCSDGKNSGYEVELTPEQNEAYTNFHSVDTESPIPTVAKTTPHITVSMEEGAKAVDTGMLPFSKEGFEPFIVHGKAGFFTSRTKDKERISEIIFEPVLKESKDTIKSQESIK